MTPRPLKGRRILVTRPQGADELARRLRNWGASVVHVPLIRIAPPRSWAPLDAAVRRLDRYDWVLFTSANAVRAFFGRLRGRKVPRRVGAVGPATAAAIRTAGGRVLRVAREHRAVALAAALRPLRGRHILLPQADIARQELRRVLVRRGARVDAVTAYRTLTAPGARRRLGRAAGGLDVVAFASSSAVESLARALGPGFRRLFRNVRAASIGPQTSATLRALGVEPAFEADPHTAAGLARAIKRGLA